jgi:predicted enzyme related to lactoylglutathione lyase
LGFEIQYTYTDPEGHETLTVLEIAGGNLVREPVEIPEVAKWFFICDPDQNVIEIVQYFQSQQGAA